MKKILVILVLSIISINVNNAQTLQDWGRKQAITINNTYVTGSSDLTDFPFLVTLDHLDPEIVDGGANSALNGGGDIRFSSDAAGNNRLACEIVSLVTDATAANRQCQVWVKIPSLSSTSDTTIYIWYNKSGETQPVATDTYGSQAVWSNNYVSTWHLDEGITAGGSTHQILDSGSNSNDGVSATNMNTNNSLACKVGDGIDLLGNNFFNVGNDASLNLTSNLTVSGWFNPHSFGAFYVLGKRSETVENGYNILPQLAGHLAYYDGTTIHSTGMNYNINEWNYAVIKLNASGTGMTAFLNGNFSSEITVVALPDGLAQNLYLGARSNGSLLLDGIIDELRISNIARSDDWISTEYNNQNSPSTFATSGTPVSVSADTESPTPPTLSSTDQTDTTVDLSWLGATDNIGVTGYNIYIDGVLETTLGNVSSYQ
ncbi:LamG-like jellyroll fold domain-containing protein, partial [Flavivirga aquimarina]